MGNGRPIDPGPEASS